MKKDVTIYHKISRILVGVVFLVLLAAGGCSNVLMKSPAAPEAAGPGGGVKVTLRLFTGSARTVMPEMDLLTWHITAKQGTDNIEATGTYPTYTLELPTVGRWIFTVKGINPTGDEIFTGSVTPEIGGGSSVTISIPLSPGSGMGEGTGTIDLTMTVPTDVTKVMYKLDSDTEFTDLTPSNGSCSLNKAGVSAGIHTLSLYFLDERGTTLYMCTEAVNVWNGMTSSQWINTGNIGYITGNGEFELTDVIIDAFLNTMGSVVYVNDSVAVNAPATGSIFAPVNSVSTAVDILRKANPGENYNGTIMVSGATAIDQEIEVKNGETLTVKGTGADASITNDAGRVFNIASGGSLTLGENITLTGTVTNGNGGAVYVNGGTFTMEAGSKITGSSASYGGGVYVANRGTFTMGGGTISENNASGTGASGASGGGVCISSGTFTMSGGAVISGNTATSSGGGVFVSESGDFIMEGGTIGETGGGSPNSAENGGGVYIFEGTFTMSGSAVISGNNASSSSSSSSGGGVYIHNGTFTMSGGAVISGNSASSSSSSSGGGVYVSTDGIFTMEGGTIGGIDGASANSAKSGGGVCVYKGVFTMSDGSISRNTATDSGGGVFVQDGTFTMKSTAIIQENEATGGSSHACGGGVYVNGGEFTMTGTAIIQDNEATGSRGYACGGGVYVNVGEFTMNGDAIIQGNEAAGIIDYAGGGGVYVNGGGEFTMNDSAIIQKNNASTDETSKAAAGGGVYLTGGGTFSMVGNAKIQENKVTGSNGYAGGGVVVYGNCTFTMSGGIISGNSANNGGGVYVDSNGEFTMSGGTIKGNTATQNGGGMYAAGGTFTVSGSSPVITSNTANNVYLANGNTITIGEDGLDGGEIGVTVGNMNNDIKILSAVQSAEQCRIFKLSEAIQEKTIWRIEYNSEGSSGILKSTTATSVSGNVATVSDTISNEDLQDWMEASAGAGVEVEITGNMTINIDSMVSVPDGANVTIKPDTGSTVDITASGETTVFDVQAGGSLTLGGGDGEVNVSGDPSASSPTADGKEISLINISNGGTVTIADNANIQNNQAGRGVTVTDGTLIMTGGSIKGNTGGFRYGSGVYVSGENAKFEMSGGEIRGNELKLGKEQDRQGAGVLVCNGATFTLSDSGKITDNSGYEGVGVTVSGSTFNMNGGEISGNEGEGTSGGVYLVSSSIMSMNGGTITGNKAAKTYQGGGAGGVFIGLSCNFTGSTDSTTASITENYVGSSNVDVYFQSGGNGTYSPGNVQVGNPQNP